MLTAIQAFDAGVLLWIQEHLRGGWLDPLISLYTNLGEAGVLWILLSILLILFPRTRKAGVMTLVAMALCFLANDLVLKPLVQRPRPFLSVEGLIPLIEPPGSFSFPSGHSCSSFAAMGTLLQMLKGPRARWGKVLVVLLAVAMALSRLYVGVHYPTDVVIGSLVGLLGSWLICRWLGPVYDRVANRLREGKRPK